jgi:hypothetical protein
MPDDAHKKHKHSPQIMRERNKIETKIKSKINQHPKQVLHIKIRYNYNQ